MNVWAYEPKKCDGDFCPQDCDRCPKAEADGVMFNEDERER